MKNVSSMLQAGRTDVINLFARKLRNRENDVHISTLNGFSQNHLINKFADAEKIVAHQLK